MKPELAEHHMVTEICVAHPEDTVEDYLKKLKSWKGIHKNLSYVYVTESDGTLFGVIPYNDLFLSHSRQKLKELATKEVVTVSPQTDQEHVAMKAIQHRLKAIPVVDHEKKFLGVVPFNEILHILHKEHIEDFLRAAGIRHHKGSFVDVLQAKTVDMFKVRTPSLLIGLVGGMFATFIVSFFQKSLAEELVLAFFIPVIVYMSAAVGIQTETLFIRSLALSSFKMKKYLLREAAIGPLIGLLSGSILFLYSYFAWNKLNLSIIVGLSNFLTIIIAVFVGMFIPWLEVKMKKDPAVGSGPFTTIIQDIVSLVTYFMIATILL